MLEAYLLLYCGTKLVGYAVVHQKLLAAAVFYAILIRLARHMLYGVLGIAFGGHIVVGIVSLFLLCHLWLRVPALLSALAVALGHMLLSIGTVLVLVLLPNAEPVTFLDVLKMIAAEQAPLILASIVIWRTGVAIVSPKAVQHVGH
jgi:hypothetical protein